MTPERIAQLRATAFRSMEIASEDGAPRWVGASAERDEMLDEIENLQASNGELIAMLFRALAKR